MSYERILTSEYEDRVKEMIGGSACAGCPIKQERYIVPALRLDHGINWSNTSRAINVPKLALTSVIYPEWLRDISSREIKELNEDFTRFFGQTPEEFVEKAEPPITADDISKFARGLIKGLPEKNMQAGDALVEELKERLANCPNTRKRRVTCAFDK